MNTLGGCIHWADVYTGRMYTLGGCIHWADVYTGRMYTLGGCMHVGRMLHTQYGDLVFKRGIQRTRTLIVIKA